MVDLNVAIYNLLKPIASVSLEFLDKKAKFPLITIAEVSNTEFFTVEGREHITEATYQIDVWDNYVDRSRCEHIANQVNDVMVKNHFQRVLGRGFRDVSGLHRKMMYFKTKAINLNKE